MGSAVELGIMSTQNTTMVEVIDAVFLQRFLFALSLHAVACSK
jgi:hypothetical protein